MRNAQLKPINNAQCTNHNCESERLRSKEKDPIVNPNNCEL